jgi:hypothetical protein
MEEEYRTNNVGTNRIHPLPALEIKILTRYITRSGNVWHSTEVLRPRLRLSLLSALFSIGSLEPFFKHSLADIGGTRFWRIDPNADYGKLNVISQHRLRLQRISPHWDDILQLRPGPGVAERTAGGWNPALAVLINVVQPGCCRSVLN